MAAVETPVLGDQAHEWHGTITEAVDLLLREAERRLDEETQKSFATRSPSALFLLETERARVGDLRERLRRLR
jgi:hypothetical protein